MEKVCGRDVAKVSACGGSVNSERNCKRPKTLLVNIRRGRRLFDPSRRRSLCTYCARSSARPRACRPPSGVSAPIVRRTQREPQPVEMQVTIRIMRVIRRFFVVREEQSQKFIIR